MSGEKVISRNELYDSQESDVNDTKEVVLPKFEFEIVEANNASEGLDAEGEKDQEFDFPLFSFGGNSAETEVKEDDNEEERGRRATKDNNMVRVTLRSPSPDTIDQSRPESYYFAKYTDEEQQRFQEAAVSGDDVWAQSTITHSYSMGKLIDLKEYNTKVEKELLRSKKAKSVRPGKKRRSNIIESRKKNEEREKIAKKIEKENKLKLKKERFQKRSNGKIFNKKTPQTNPKDQKPKYRTE